MYSMLELRDVRRHHADEQRSDRPETRGVILQKRQKLHEAPGRRDSVQYEVVALAGYEDLWDRGWVGGVRWCVVRSSEESAGLRQVK